MRQVKKVFAHPKLTLECVSHEISLIRAITSRVAKCLRVVNQRHRILEGTHW